jgi:urease accessory protein
VALPGLDGAESVLAVTATVEPGGTLEYLPEPVVVADGARHATDIRVTLAEGARLVLRDELILGRHGERGGSYRGSLRADYAGRPLLRQSLEVSGSDGAARGPAVLAGHRACGTVLRVGPDRPGSARAAPCADRQVAVMPLAAGPAVLVTALANDAVTLRRRLR